jgi:hypothetical protein
MCKREGKRRDEERSVCVRVRDGRAALLLRQLALTNVTPLVLLRHSERAQLADDVAGELQ